jgi:hypothetical protein
VVKPDSIPDAAKLSPLLDIGRSVWHWGSWIRGGTLYRAGQYEESLRAFEGATRINRPRAWDWCFAAMAHHRLGHVDESRRCLAAAARWIDEANAETEHDLSDTEPNWSDWPEHILYPLLLREAEQLLNEKPSASKLSTTQDSPH